ncbi:hypothetical protein L1887_16356 [Cichorium endivia]|nr:hypothetical protein L1887_16356 [Cichorium endivia]
MLSLPIFFVVMEVNIFQIPITTLSHHHHHQLFSPFLFFFIPTFPPPPNPQHLYFSSLPHRPPPNNSIHPSLQTPISVSDFFASPVLIISFD